MGRSRRVPARRFTEAGSPKLLSFGSGPHDCLGTALARLELKILFEETLKRMPSMEIAGEPRYVVSPFVNQLKTLPARW